MGDFASVAGAINPPGVGPSAYQFVNNPVGQLGQGTEGYGLNRSFSDPVGPLYGPGQSGAAHYQPGLPYGGLNKRDLSPLSGPVSPVSLDPTVNALLGNGAYLHGVVTLQDLTNVMNAAGTNNGG
jgi:hypothetical protein